MADILVKPARLSGSIMPPPSKSDAHRALIAAWLAGSPELVSGLPEPWSADLRATADNLRLLLKQEDGFTSESRVKLDCGESGSTLRFLIPIAAALGRSAVFTGHGRLPFRPLDAFKAVLPDKGITMQFPEDRACYLPLTLSGQLQPGLFAVAGDISSQYITGLLFALPLLSGDSEIRLTTPLQSAPYVEMTLAVLKHFGLTITVQTNNRQPVSYQIKGGQQYKPVMYQVEADYSQAAFWYTAAFMGHDIKVTGMKSDTRQGDQAIVPLLKLLRQGQTDLDIDVSQIPDLVPILAVAATQVSRKTSIINAGRLRYKESDRLQAITDALFTIGADIEAFEDRLTIRGKTCSRRDPVLQGGQVDGCNDHRIVMAMSIAALATEQGIRIHDAQAIEKSYPRFFDDLVQLGGIAHGLHLG